MKSTYFKDFINSFVSIAKGLWVTVVNWGPARPCVTELYPEQRPVLPEAYRGMPTLPVDPATGRSKCIGCGACARMCPQHIITIEVDKSDPKNRKPARFEIDISRCLWCGLCEEVCPTGALKSGRDYELACYSRDGMKYGLEQLMAAGGELPVEEPKPVEESKSENV